MRSRLPSATIRISIQALRGEGDVSPPGDRQAEVISIHALRGEGDRSGGDLRIRQRISIHALRGEGDMFLPVRLLAVLNFNPRPPWGGRP